jgi:hypothetical protein
MAVCAQSYNFGYLAAAHPYKYWLQGLSDLLANNVAIGPTQSVLAVAADKDSLDIHGN